MMKLNGFAALSLGLVIAVLLLVDWGFRLNKEKELIIDEKQELVNQLLSLEELQTTLKIEVDTLMSAYGNVAQENELLKKLLQNTNTRLAKHKYDFNQFRMESMATIYSLKENVQRLVKAKSTLEITIQKTVEENELLLEQTGIDPMIYHQILLKSEEPEAIFAHLQEEYTYVLDYRKSIVANERLKQIRANQKPSIIEKKGLVATAFRTELERRSGKATVNGKQVKKILVSFDIEEVSAEDLAEQTFFLVIQDNRRQLIKKDPAIVNITIKGLMQPIKIVQSKTVILENTQRIEFDVAIEERLEDGYYLVYVYGVNGLLGKTSFRVD